MFMADFDLIVLGGGPAGYTGAIRAAQLGLNTAIIDKREVLGGTCLNIGCIPSKALLVSSQYVRFAHHEAQHHGLKLEGVQVDLAKLIGSETDRREATDPGSRIPDEENNITRIRGTGQLVAPAKVVVTKPDGSTEGRSSRYIILATGSVPMDLANVTVDRENVVTSDEALSFSEVPARAVSGCWRRRDRPGVRLRFHSDSKNELYRA